MLLNPVVATRYAKSLFQLAHSDKMKPEEILKELELFSEAFEKDIETKKFFLNPTITRDLKVEVLKELSSKLKLVDRFLIVLAEGDRLGLIREIISEFKSMVEDLSGEMSVELQVAQELSEKSVQQIGQIIELQWKRKPRFTITKNKKLIGGFIAKAPGRTLDASVRSQLKNLRTRLLVSQA